MSGITVTPSLARISDQLRTAEAMLGTPRPLLKAMAVTLLGEVARQFKEEGRPAWAPMRESTRMGKRKSSGRLLAGLRGTFDASIADRRAVVFSNDPRTVFHQYGTRGPYDIYPRTAKALALPFLPGRDAQGGGVTGRGQPGQRSLAGLGRSTARSGGGFIFQPPRGKAVPKRFQGREGKAVVASTNLAFYRHVVHPGLPARPMLPSEREALPLLVTAADAFLTRVAARGTGRA